jgi:hypothetical protein
MKTEIIKCEICTAPATLWLDKVNEVGEVCITCFHDCMDGHAGYD